MNKNAITRVAAVAAAVVATAPSSSQAMIPEVSDVTMTQSATRRGRASRRDAGHPDKRKHERGGGRSRLDLNRRQEHLQRKGRRMEEGVRQGYVHDHVAAGPGLDGC